MSCPGERHIRKILAVICASLAAASVAGEAAAHARLISAAPKAGATVSALKALTLTFSEKIVPAKSSVAMTGPQGAVSLGPLALDPKNPRVVAVPIGPLSPGAYKVKWSMTTEDTHTMQGSYAFSVK